MAEIGSYCTHCGAKVESNSKFCTGCGKATSLAAAQATTSSAARKTISRDRAILAYIMGIIIIGTGHMVVGRVARGILILVGAIALGIITSFIFLGLFFIAIVIYWIL